MDGFSALIVIVMIVLCSACQKKTTPSVTHPTSLTQSHVDILTPESSNDIDPNAPLNTWDNVTHSIVEQMQSQVFLKIIFLVQCLLICLSKSKT